MLGRIEPGEPHVPHNDEPQGGRQDPASGVAARPSAPCPAGGDNSAAGLRPCWSSRPSPSPSRRRPSASRAGPRRCGRRPRRRCGGSCRRSWPCRPSPPTGRRSVRGYRPRRRRGACRRRPASRTCDHLRPAAAASSLLQRVGDLVESLVDLGLDVLVHLDPGDAGLVVDRHRRPVRHPLGRCRRRRCSRRRPIGCSRPPIPRACP